MLAPVLKTAGLVLLAVGMGYLKYLSMRSINERKDEKADVQTIFAGRK